MGLTPEFQHKHNFQGPQLVSCRSAKLPQLFSYDRYCGQRDGGGSDSNPLLVRKLPGGSGDGFRSSWRGASSTWSGKWAEQLRMCIWNPAPTVPRSPCPCSPGVDPAGQHGRQADVEGSLVGNAGAQRNSAPGHGRRSWSGGFNCFSCATVPGTASAFGHCRCLGQPDCPRVSAQG